MPGSDYAPREVSRWPLTGVNVGGAHSNGISMDYNSMGDGGTLKEDPRQVLTDLCTQLSWIVVGSELFNLSLKWLGIKLGDFLGARNCVEFRGQLLWFWLNSNFPH